LNNSALCEGVILMQDTACVYLYFKCTARV